MVQPGRTLRTEVRLLLLTELDALRGPCSSRRREASERMLGRDTIPELAPPDDAMQMHQGTSDQGTHRVSRARLRTDRDLQEIAQHYHEQLRIGGWSRQGGGEVGAFAWSVWSFQGEDGTAGYGLFWLVRDAGRPGHYSLAVEAIGVESP
jgi:hypothetical protein